MLTDKKITVWCLIHEAGKNSPEDSREWRSGECYEAEEVDSKGDSQERVLRVPGEDEQLLRQSFNKILTELQTEGSGEGIRLLFFKRGMTEIQAGCAYLNRG